MRSLRSVLAAGIACGLGLLGPLPAGEAAGDGKHGGKHGLVFYGEEDAKASSMTSDKPEVRDTAALDKVRLRLDILTRCHTAAVRREATERLGRYAKEQPALDRTKQLEVAFGDVGALLVDALIKAEGGDWETVVAKVKAAAKRLSDGKNLAELMNDMALRSERGAQMSLPGV